MTTMTKAYRLSDGRVAKVRELAEFLTQRRGYRVTLEIALAEMVDAFCLPSRSSELSNSIQVIEQTTDQPA